jgi:CSLREA domain-containing protein
MRTIRTLSICCAVLLALMLALSPFSSISVRSAPITAITVNTLSDQFNTDPTHCSLREAILAANNDSPFAGCPAGSGADTINLSIGTYTLSIAGTNEDANTCGDLDISQDLTIHGQGPDTIIDAAYIDRVLDIQSGASVTLEELTVQHGHSPNGNGGAADGGGIRNHGSLSLTGVSVMASQAGNGAGGNPNAASGGDGGGIYSDGISLVIQNSRILINNAGAGENGKELGFGGNGGGIYADDEMIVISNTTISGNTAGAAGASSTTATGGSGGGIYLRGDASISASAIDNNTAGSSMTSDGGRGGGIYANSTTTIINSTISGNTSGSSTASLFKPGAGGGVVASSPMSIRFTTIYDNHVGTGYYMGNGGGILSESSDYLTLGSSIVAGNTAGVGPDCYSPGTVISEDYNLVQVSNGCTFSGPTANSLFDLLIYTLPSLAYNGGPTRTHALIAGNLAIDAGNPSSFPARDQRGYFRPVDGSGGSPAPLSINAEPGPGVPDIGAYEQGSFLLDLFSWLPAILKFP